MKTVSVREFYHNAALVDGLPAGQSLVVTSNGVPKFIVTKEAPPRMTRELAESRAIGNSKAKKFDSVAFLRSLKK